MLRLVFFLFVFDMLGLLDIFFILNISVVGKCCLLYWRILYNGESLIKIYILYFWVIIIVVNGLLYKEYLSFWNIIEMSYVLDLDWD